MLEESISCSPGNSGKKSRSRRFHKNVKKKCEHNVTRTTPRIKNIIQKELSKLEVLYEESTHSRTNVETHLEYFHPFENEKLLASADRVDPSPSSTTLKDLTCKGFIRLENLPLPFKSENTIDPMQPPERALRCYSAVKPISPQVLGPETQFGITESELARFCNDAESVVLSEITSDKKETTANDIRKDLYESIIEHKVRTPKTRKSKSVVEEILTDFCGSPTQFEIDEHTPYSPPINIKETKSIVDEILEDFCGSPYRENSPKVNSEDDTPIFRFKSQSIRTYSRIRKKNLFTKKSATDFNDLTLKYDGNTSDSSSCLSVQEDLTQSVVPQLDTVDLNNSVKLCENLLNLSSYFSQLPSSSSKDKSPPDAEIRGLRLSAITDEIIKLKSKSLRINWNKIEKEFMGFSDYESDSKESTLQELLEEEDDVLQKINCDSLCYEQIEPKASFAHVDSDIENTLQNASAVIEKAKALISSEPDVEFKAKKMIKMYQTDCDIQNQSLCLNSPLEDEGLFDDIDIWNDNEYLLNYKTQKYFVNHVENEDNDFSKDDFNENKAFSKCKESETRKTIQVSKSDTKGELLKPSYKSPQNCKFGQQFQILKDPCSSVSLKLSENLRKNEQFKTNDGSSNIGYKKAESIRNTVINALPGATINFLTEKNYEYSNKVPGPNLAGFATASKKPILISDVARQKANEFLKKIEQQDLEERSALNKNVISTENMTTDRTVCNIPTLLPEEIIGEFKENEVKSHSKYNIPSNTSKGNIINSNCSAGFTTASKKNISISYKAKQKADEMITKFEQDEKEKRMLERTFLITEELFGNEKKNKSAPEKKVQNNLTVAGFTGFSTASEKPIEISLEAKRKADKILKKFEEAENPEEECDKLTQRHPSEVSEEVRRKAQELLLDIEFFEEAFEDELKKIEGLPVSQINNGKQRTDKIVGEFKTASRKPIHISEEASRRAETFFKTICEDLSQEYHLNDTNVNSKNNLIGKVEQVDGAIKSPKTESKQMHATNGIECLLASENRIINRSQSDSDIEGLGELKKDAYLYIRDYDRIQNITFRKRKHSEGDELEKSSLSVTPRRLSCCERVPLNCIDNGLLCKSFSMPLKEGTPTSAVISRKNLLSLSKRRKFDSPRRSGPKTPEKGRHSQVTLNNACSTPNLEHFFGTVSTSTPRLIRNDPKNINNQNPSKDAIDSDFRRIQWEDSNNSIRINRTSCVDDVNVTFSAVSPSPKQRIEQLKMYGEPPAISPISMLNNCRPSGLRRGRSLLKP